MLGVIDRLPTAALSGRVFMDANNNGLDNAEAGIAGTTVALSGTNANHIAVNLTTVTGADGSYLFGGLLPGTYAISEAQPAEYLDGNDGAGNLGGTVGNDLITNIIVNGQNGSGYNFGELTPSNLSGFVYQDFNDDGQINFNEYAIRNALVSLTGIDDRGNAVSTSQLTDTDGLYFFVDLRPGVYSVTETQPAGYQDGQDTLGTAGGTAGNDIFSGIGLAAGLDGANYNFGERPLAGTAVTAGQTATIGFWQNKNGQSLIKALNGGVNAIQLGNWLAATFPNIYGANSVNNLAGMSNANVAGFYQALFQAKAKQAQKGAVTGPAKVDCQVMATAFAAYVTNSALAGNVAGQYGFLVTANGVGVATFNVGSAGAAFGVANNTQMTVMDLLLASNEQTIEGVLYKLNDALRAMANQVYTAINESGHIA